MSSPAGSTGPEHVQTRADLAAGLEAVRTRSGLSLRQIATRSEEMAAAPVPGTLRLPRTTVSGLLASGRLSVGQLRTFLTVCEVSDADRTAWETAWHRVNGGPAPRLAERLTALREAAGQPTLLSVAERARTLRDPTVTHRGAAVRSPSHQRIGEWIAGRSVPAHWPQFELVLRALIERAQRKHPRPPIPDLYQVATWRELWRAARKLSELGDDELCPYRGLEVFEQEHSSRFFGRAAATSELLHLLDATVEAGGPLMVVGSSGVGKSSLLRAGLLPEIRAGGLSMPGSACWPVLILSPGSDPVGELARGIPELAAVVSPATAQEGTADTSRDSAGGVAVPSDVDIAALTSAAQSNGQTERRIDPARVRAAVKTASEDRAGPGARMILIIDQFEELFTLCGDAERRDFIEIVHAASAAPHGGMAPAAVIISVRADFYARCLEHPMVAAALRNHMQLGPMSADELREVITGPAEDAGLRVGAGLVELLLTDAGVRPARDQIDVGVLPMLSHALSQTWRYRKSGMLTVAGYRAAGEIRGAVERTAERALSELDAAGRRAADQLMLQLVRIGDGGGEPDTRQRRERQRLIEHASDPDAAEHALEVLVRARLVTLDAQGAQLAHEALLNAWSRLPALIEKHRTELLRRQRVEHDAQAWEDAGQDPTLLYQTSRLDDARQSMADPDLDRPSPLAQAFVGASRRQRRVRAWFRGGVAILGVVLALIAGVAAVTARSQARDAEFAATLAEADRLRSVDPSLAARLYLVAHQMRDQDPEVAGRVLSTQNSPLAATLPSRGGSIYDTAFSSDGRTLVTASHSGDVQLWDVADPQNRVPLGAPLPSGSGYASSAMFSPDDHTLVSANEDGTIRLWDVRDRAHPVPLGVPLAGDNGEIYLIRFSPDGRLLAAANADGTVRLWSTADPAHPTAMGEPLVGHTAQARSVTFSPDGNLLASGADDGTVLVWDVTNPRHPIRSGPALPGHTGAVHSVEFSPDGNLLASGGDDKITQVWDITDRQHPTLLGIPLTGQRGAIWSVEFGADGNLLATGSADGSVWLWSVSRQTGATPILDGLAGAAGALYTIALSPDGHTLVAGGEDGTTLMWSLPVTVLAGHTGRVFSVAVSPDGRTLASGSADHTIRLWDITRPDAPSPLGAPLLGHQGFVLGLGWSANGQILASQSAQDGQLRLWDVRDRIHPTLIGQPTQLRTRWAGAVASQPGRHVLVTPDTDNTAQPWDITDPAAPMPLGAPLAHDGWINAISFTPDGATMATASSDGTVRLWDMSNPARAVALATINPQAGQILGVDFSPDGQVLANTGEDRIPRLWDVANRAQPAQLAELPGHNELVSAVALSPDGRTLASGSRDTIARIWSVPDAGQSSVGLPLSGHVGGVNAVAFTPDGKFVITASEDDTLMLWDLNIDHAIERICATTHGAITPESSRRTRLPYTPTCGDP